MRNVNTLLIKPSSYLCNMKCAYCFYVDEELNRNKKYGKYMDKETLENIISKFLLSTSIELNLVFQGGEPLLIGLDFYKCVIELVNKYNRNNIKVNYSLQTNGILLDENYAKFFKKNNFLIGVSLDGTKEIHDKYRCDSYDKVTQKIKILDKYYVDYNILTVVSKDVSLNFKDVYESYKTNNFKYVQYIPLIDGIEDEKGSHEYSINNELYFKYLKESFDLWYNDLLNDKRWYHRFFDSLLNKIYFGYTFECTIDKSCGLMYSFESNGDTYPCDFYMTDDYLLGNINTSSIDEIDKKREEIDFLNKNQLDKCKRCKYFSLCSSGCKRDYANGMNYYCEAYYKFFEYSKPKFDKIIKLVKEHKI